MKKVIELIRVSTEGQAASDRASIPAQRAINRRTAAQYGLEIIRTIELADVSGAAVLQTSEIQQMLKLMESPDIAGVVTREFSRLMRPENFADFALLQAFADTRTLLYLPDGPIDFGNKTGQLMGGMRALIAGLERNEIKERVWAAKEEKRRRGELAQAPVCLPFGVGYDPRTRAFFYKPEAERVREAYRQFLAGEHSYLRLSKLVGITPRGMHLLMRNPIWMGWRVIDKKRDTSAAGRYAGKNGRQADRRKIRRTEDEIIRVQVVREPLIPAADWERVQQIMDLKQQHHWRSRPDYEHRFTYSGFLRCAECGSPIHSCYQRRDYYVCKGRREQHHCQTPYMSKERLEAQLDRLFAERLTNRRFLHRCILRLQEQAASNETARRIAGLRAEIERLRARRGRILDTFLEGVMTQEERDQRLQAAEHDLQERSAELMRLEAQAPASLTAAMLTQMLAPLAEWKFWTREQRRKVLAALMPQIRVARYQVQTVGVRLDRDVLGMASRTGRDSWLP